VEEGGAHVEYFGNNTPKHELIVKKCSFA